MIGNGKICAVRIMFVYAYIICLFINNSHNFSFTSLFYYKVGGANGLVNVLLLPELLSFICLHERFKKGEFTLSSFIVYIYMHTFNLMYISFIQHILQFKETIIRNLLFHYTSSNSSLSDSSSSDSSSSITESTSSSSASSSPNCSTSP